MNGVSVGMADSESTCCTGTVASKTPSQGSP
jgi:hypothetical protein